MPPHFRQPTALLNCEQKTLRWPGPFDTGFLSPQPPGVAGIGSIAELIIPTGPTRVGPFSFSGDRSRCCSTRGGEGIFKIPSPVAPFQIPFGITPDIDEHRPVSVAEPLSSHGQTAAITRTGNRTFKNGWYRRMFDLSGV